MVGGRWVTRKGQRVWQEWAPDPCVGHPPMRPRHGECPRCRVWMGRVWSCPQCGRVEVDPEHEQECPGISET
ncbi:hypothetical protein [Micromonospora deserti]|uniref:hypothetical protein n=1 Tax=Micromonospora deserti TaxID=2070366 RepID=UPI0011B70004|nr:hypothetical protein [Micromonospora deserti]